ncbi:hypothetical protein [Chitinimonas taiwanensis]|uniref:hypothetical protein n=1 Tax=Chitinimonas taiwanensis TaxID=240412 RepID=UPI0035B0CFEF
MSWIITANGQEFDYLDPARQPIDFKVIAHALSQINRFNGHTQGPYSVAEHCTRMLDVAYSHSGIGYVDVADIYAFEMAVLLHDAAEAYIGDIVRPLKLGLGSVLAEIEERIQAAIHLAAGLPAVLPAHWTAAIKRLDMVMLATEKRDLLYTPANARPWDCLAGVEPLQQPIRPWPSYVAEASFLMALDERMAKTGGWPAKTEA